MNRSFKKIGNLILFFAASGILSASLMMSAKEIRELDKLTASTLDSDKTRKGLEETAESEAEAEVIRPDHAVYLSAILYLGPTNWTVWINDRTFTDEAAEDDLIRVVKVSSHDAEIEFKNGKLGTVKLRPNQTLITANGGHIADGDARRGENQKPRKKGYSAEN